VVENTVERCKLLKVTTIATR